MGQIVSVKDAAKILKDNDNILILTHKRPDGDTTGSAGAICAALRKIGKKAYVLQNPEITNRYAPLNDKYYPADDFKPDFIMTTDIADSGLFSENALKYIKTIDLAIDHHRSNPLFAKFNVVEPETAACGEIVYELIVELGVAIDEEIAYSIYIAISTDTGCFKFSNTTSHTHIVAAKCLETSIDGGEINRAMFETKSMRRFEIEKYVFDNMEFYNNGRIAIVIITRDIIDKVGADIDDLDSIASLTRQIEGVECGITVTENQDGTVKVSVRTTKEIDASAICCLCGGGGHLRAAGASFESSSNNAKKKILKAVEEIMDSGN